MKVLDLQCRHGHAFEGWFASEDDYVSQLKRGLLACPLCGEGNVIKKLSAPRLNLLGGRAQPAAAADAPAGDVAEDRSRQAAWMHAVRHVLACTEDVGAGFAEEARRIHCGEAQRRGIRGSASVQDAAELLREGIAVLPLAVPDALKEPLQ
jgi:hypothetical protein